jgi:hypothetical protein
MLIENATLLAQWWNSFVLLQQCSRDTNSGNCRNNQN